MDTGIDALFAAVDISGLSTNTQTLMIAFLIIPILFLGNAVLKRVIRSMGGR